MKTYDPRTMPKEQVDLVQTWLLSQSKNPDEVFLIEVEGATGTVILHKYAMNPETGMPYFDPSMPEGKRGLVVQPPETFTPTIAFPL